jgi:hypothetical protein
MKRFVPGLTLALLLAGGTATPATGQIGFVLGGGATIPMGDFGDFAATGWMALAGAKLGLPLLPIQFRVEGLYGQNAHDGPTTDKTNLYGGMANVIFQIGPPLVPVKPYVIAGGGYLNHKFSPGNSGLPAADEWKPVFGGGVGVSVSLMVIGVFVEARYLRRDDTGFIPVMAGIRLGG